MSVRRDDTSPATIQDVADLAGVSRAAVSKVIRGAYGVSPAMREQVNAAIAELGYRPSVSARAMRGPSYTLGIELPGIGNPYFTKIVSGATRTLGGTRYQLVVAPADNDLVEGRRSIEALLDRRVDGLVAISPLVEPAWLAGFAGRVPLVMIGRHDQTEAYDTVTGDDTAGARQAMEHLLSLGHRRIAHLTTRDEVTQPSVRSPHGLRLAEYEAVMAAHGLPSRVVRVHGSQDQARDVVRQLLDEEHPPTAVFAGNDTLALDVLWVRAERGLSAGELSTVGYDDIEIAAHPAMSLTTVDQSGVEMGERAVAMLLGRIAGRREAVHHEIRPELRVRGSTAPVAGPTDPFPAAQLDGASPGGAA